MKKTFLFLALLVLSVTANAQDENNSTQNDSLTVHQLDEVLVKGIRVEENAPITHSNLTKEDLESRNLGQDIPVLLNYLPSVVTTSDAGAGIGYTGIRVRGVSAASTNITINGIPYNDAESLGTFWVNLPDFSSSVESLQLQRGVGTSTNGSGAFGASINVLTASLSDTANGEISNSVGSYGTRKHTLKFSTGKLNDHIEISGRLSKIKSDGYIDRASSDLKSHFLQATYVDADRLIKVLTFGGHEKTYQSWYGLDSNQLALDRTFNPAGSYTDENGVLRFYDNQVDNYKQDHYQLHWNEKLNGNLTLNVGLNYTYGRGYYEEYKEDEDFANYGLNPIVLGGQTIATTDLIRRRWLDNDFYVMNVGLNFKKDNLDASFGSSISHYDGDHFGEIIWAQNAGGSEIRDHYYDGNGKKNDFNVFLKTNLKLNSKINLFADLQYRGVSYKTTGTSSDNIPFLIDEGYSFFNPKAGITYAFNNKTHMYASYARANREPSRGDFENNPNVKPEQLNDLELGWRFKSKKISLSTNVYYMSYNEQLVLTGALDNTGAPIRDNSGESYRLGLEVEAVIQIINRLTWQPNFTISRNKNKETHASFDGELVNYGKTNISFSPDVIVSNALVWKPLKRMDISIFNKYVGTQFMGNNDSSASKLDSYFVTDFNMSYEFKIKKIFKSIVVSGLVNNILNEKYVSNGYYFTYDDTWSAPGTTTTIEGAGYYPQATRNFLLGVTMKF